MRRTDAINETDDMHGDDVIRRWTEGPVIITATVWIFAETEHVRHVTMTTRDGRLLGAYYPADITRQTGWRVAPASGTGTRTVPTESHAIAALLADA